jgi:outer membrane lipase/esterase
MHRSYDYSKNAVGLQTPASRNVEMNFIKPSPRRFRLCKYIAAVLCLQAFVVGAADRAAAGNLGDVAAEIAANNASNDLGQVFGVVNAMSDPGQRLDALQQLNNEENGAVGRLTTEASAFGLATIAARLANLRAGGASVLAFNPTRNPPLLLASNEPVPATAAAAENDAADGFSRLGFFFHAIGATGERKSTLSPSTFDGEPGFDYDTFGFLAGADYRFTDRFILGVAFGYASTDADLDANAGDFNADGYDLMAYGTYYADRLYINEMISFGRNDYEARRNIFVNGLPDPIGPPSGPGFLAGIASADYSGSQDTVSLGGGYDINIGGLAMGPYARLDYFRTHINGYREEVRNMGGASQVDSLGLEIRDQEVNSLSTAVGGRATYSLSMPFGVLTPQISLDWQHEYADNSRDVIAQYSDDVGNSTFIIATDDPDRDYFNLGIGISAVFPRGITAFANYATPIGLDKVTSHHVTAGVRFEL